MATCQQSQIWQGQSLTALTYILQYAKRQTPLMDIEQKLFALAI